MADILSFAGDFSLEKCVVISSTGVQFDIRNQVLGIQIYEDLYSPFISGTVIFKDSLDFMNALPFVGQESLDLVIYTPGLEKHGGKISAQFYIHKLKDREFDANRSVLYEMCFISREFLSDVNVKLSRAYQGKVSDIVKELLYDKSVGFNAAKKVNIEETKNSIKYVSNYWSPLKNINYLTDHAVNTRGSPSYLFFENREGFNFGSIDLLMSDENKVKQEFNYSDFNQIVNPNGSSARNVNLDFQRITDFHVTDGFNTIERMQNGMIASRLYSHDLTGKQIHVKNFDIYSNFKEKRHLNPYPTVSKHLPSYYTSKKLIVPKSTMQFTGFGDISNVSYIQRRISELSQARDFKINITVPGRFDYTVGQVIRVKTFQVEPMSKNEPNKDLLDKIFSGKYIIAAINHSLTMKSHECNIELIKDSYNSDLFKGT